MCVRHLYEMTHSLSLKNNLKKGFAMIKLGIHKIDDIKKYIFFFILLYPYSPQVPIWQPPLIFPLFEAWFLL